MDATYLGRLSNDIGNLVGQIESATQLQIAVLAVPERLTMACEANLSSVTLFTPSDDYFQDGPVLHELLHVRRLLVDCVPRLTDCDQCHEMSPETVGAIVDLDNKLEHLVIVPEELARLPNRKAHWDNALALALDKLPHAQLSSADLKRQVLIKGLFIRIALAPTQLETRLANLEHDLGLTDAAEQFHHSMCSALGAKEDAVLLAFEVLQLPLAIASLEYLNALKRTAYAVPLTMLK